MRKYQICACLLTKDENEYLEEWLAWHTGTGIEHFYIYDNGSKDPVRGSIPAEYWDCCTVVDFGGEHMQTQHEAYADCLTRFGGETEWMAFIDTDEFIRVVDGADLGLFLREFGDADALAMRWVVYNADGQLHKTGKPVRERFRQTVEYPASHPQCKCIVRPERIKAMGPHFPLEWGARIVNERHQPVCSITDPAITHDRVLVDHYFTRSLEEWREKMARGSCDPYYAREFGWFEQLNPGLVAKEGL